MPHNEILAARIRKALTRYQKHLTEKRMIGGHCFLYKGKMSFGFLGNDLMVKVTRDKYAACLKKPHCRVMEFKGKILKSFLRVEPEGIQTEKQLRAWLKLGMESGNTKAVKKLENSP
jgi:TfoX/Sxy family transcriptional regulator of competence genes